MNRSVKGLLIKDFRLMKSQMKFFIVIMMLWGVFMSANFSPHFFMGYIAVLFSFVALSTINYDEYEKGMAYLLTLPVLKKDYIRGKYIFGCLVTALPAVFAAVLSYAVVMVKGMEADPAEYLMAVAFSVSAGCLMLAFEIPLQIKFGQEKSRIVSIISVGMAAAGLGIIGHLNDITETSGSAVSGILAGLGDEMLVLLAVLAAAVLLCISYQISCRIMDRKEF